MSPSKKAGSVQKEFSFSSRAEPTFLADPPRPQDLGNLPVKVMVLSKRARKWLSAHGIKKINQLVDAHSKKLISRQCLDNSVRKELHRELGHYWNGKKYKYILALNFLDRGVDRVLSQRKRRETPVKTLDLSDPVRKLIGDRQVETVGQLFLQPELEWRNPRNLGNILVNEILIALCGFLDQNKE